MLPLTIDFHDNSPSRILPVILVAEDEVLVRNFVCLALQREGYHVLAASDGKDALELSRAYSGRIQMLLTDVKMPQMNGIVLAQQVIKEREGVRVLVMSGKLSSEVREQSLRLPFLRKPFMAKTLLDKIREVLSGPPPDPAHSES